jgi:hypothetical protein
MIEPQHRNAARLLQAMGEFACFCLGIGSRSAPAAVQRIREAGVDVANLASSLRFSEPQCISRPDGAPPIYLAMDSNLLKLSSKAQLSLRSKEAWAQVETIGRTQKRHEQCSAAKHGDDLDDIALDPGVRCAVQRLFKCSHGDLQNPTSVEAI